MSSHREAPEISKDPVADNTDLYAFVSPDGRTRSRSSPTTSRCRTRRRPELLRVRRRRRCTRSTSTTTGRPSPTSPTSSSSTPRSANPKTFLYNTGPITSLDSPNWNRPQFYSVTRMAANGQAAHGAGARTCLPAVQHRPALDAELRDAAPTSRGAHDRQRRRVFAGQRAEGFYVDLGRIFDLGALRPFQHLHLIPIGRRGRASTRTQGLNVHTIAIQVPITELTRTAASSRPTSASPESVDRRLDHGQPPQVADLRRQTGDVGHHGPWDQVSRLGNPLFNEVIVPMAREGRLERDAARRTTSSSPKYVAAPGAGQAAAGALPGRVPEPARRYHKPTGRPGGDPADRHPGGDRPGLPELHRDHAGRHAAAEHGDPAGRRTRTRSGWSAATRPASRTGAGWPTTW